MIKFRKFIIFIHINRIFKNKISYNINEIIIMLDFSARNDFSCHYICIIILRQTNF